MEQLLRELTPESDSVCALFSRLWHFRLFKLPAFRFVLTGCHQIGDAMVWCADHATCAQEICECIYESLTIDETPLHKKIARWVSQHWSALECGSTFGFRLYLISDLLANAASRGVRDVFYFRQYFGELLTKVGWALLRIKY